MVKNDTLENARPELHGLIVEDLKGTSLSYRAIGLRRRCGEHVVWAVAEANGLWRRWSAMDEAVDRALNPPPKLVIASLIDARFPEIAKMATPGRPQGGPAVAAVRQRFWRAVDALVGDGSIQERLVRAAQHLMTLASEGLPEGLRGEFDAIWNRLTREKAAGGEG